MSCRVAAVVVAYSSNAELPRCLGSLEGRVEEAVVVDNCPGAPVPPGLRAAHPWVNWIDNPSNRGFAAGVNQGVAATSAPFVLLMNPDCELLTRLDGLLESCRPARVAGAGGLLINLDGSPQAGFMARSFPTAWTLAFEVLGVNRFWQGNPVNRRFRLRGLDPGAEIRVDQPAGAFLMLKRQALNAVGGLDEEFRPAWFEDVDLCRRLCDAGFTLLYSPAASARHVGGHAVEQLPMPSRLNAWYGGLLRYAEKHLSQRAHGHVRAAVLLGLALRRAYCVAGGGSSADARAYGSLCRLVRRGFPRRFDAP